MLNGDDNENSSLIDLISKKKNNLHVQHTFSSN